MALKRALFTLLRELWLKLREVIDQFERRKEGREEILLCERSIDVKFGRRAKTGGV